MAKKYKIETNFKTMNKQQITALIKNQIEPLLPDTTGSILDNIQEIQNQ